MKKSLFYLLSVGFILTFFTVNAMAMWSFEISDEGNDGSYDLIFLSDEGNVSIQSYSLGFGYDQEELSLASISYNAPNGYMLLGSPNTSEAGVITDVSAMTFGATLAPDTTIATFTFNVLATDQVQDGDPDFYFLNWGSTADGNFGINYNNNPTQFYPELSIAGNLSYGANVDKGSTVPIPSAILLLGGGLFGLVGIRRKAMH